jgi:hypothetical protein
MTDDRRQMTDDRGRMTEDRLKKVRGWGGKTEVGSGTRRRPQRKGLCRGKDAEGGIKKHGAESKGQRVSIADLGFIDRDKNLKSIIFQSRINQSTNQPIQLINQSTNHLINQSTIF